jgi:hypothetical protein
VRDFSFIGLFSGAPDLPERSEEILREECARSARSAPMLIADTEPLVDALNAKDRHHEACTALFRRFRGPSIVPAIRDTADPARTGRANADSTNRRRLLPPPAVGGDKQSCPARGHRPEQRVLDRFPGRRRRASHSVRSS